jgi:hypothetical protein
VKALYLAGSLSGSARSVLNDMDASDRYVYEKLDEALRERFGTDDQSELFKARLRNRTKTKDESLQEFAHDIRRLVRLADTKAASRTLEDLTKDQFIEALGDSEVRWSVFQARPKNITEALKVSMELEAFRESEKCRLRKSVRGVKAGSNGPKEGTDEFSDELVGGDHTIDWGQMVAQIQQLGQMQRKYQVPGSTGAVGGAGVTRPPEVAGRTAGRNEAGRTAGARDGGGTGGRPVYDMTKVRCFRCDKFGHFVRDCPDLPRRELAGARKEAPLKE